MSLTLTYPGVYIQEIPSGVRPIRTVATSIAAFVDFFTEGPMNEPVRLQGMSDLVRRLGGLDTRSAASYGIAEFFRNGGSEAYAVRVAATDTSVTPNNAPRRAEVRITADDGTVVMTVRAANEGVWGNHLRIGVDWSAVNASGAPTAFDLTVARYDPDDPTKVVTVEGPFRALTMDPAGARYFARIINDESALIQVAHGDWIEADHGTWEAVIEAETALDPLVAPFSFPAPNGSLGNAVVAATVSGLATGTLTIDVVNAANASVIGGAHTVNYDRASVVTGTSITTVQARRALELAIRTAAAPTTGTPTHSLLTGAAVELIGDRYRLRAGRQSSAYDPRLRVTVAATGNADVFGLDAIPPRLANVQQYALGVTVSTAGNVGAEVEDPAFVGGDGVAPFATELVGDPDDHTGIQALQNVDLFNILCLPRAAHLPDLELQAVVDAGRQMCQQRRAMLIIDIPEDVNTVEEIEDWIQAHAAFRNPNTALYFPRITIPDPGNGYRDRSIGNSGALAGVWSRIDTSRGVWKAPAGVEAVLRGVSELDIVLTDVQNGTLNPIAVNCLRVFPIYGPVVWGARTLDGADATGSEWMYIPIRRLALMIEESLFRGTKWVVFEPNDEPLWAKIRQNVSAFMMRLFRQGAFQGDTPSKAFYVKCDGETTTAADRNLGIVNIEVGFAALKPAEFVVIKIQQIPDVD